ncbi:MAG TPA: nicotinate phosphoribosyltransferase [Actinomycetota bacterium]|nr:nicotinate phosphoribosyltransferase [Actinomycetota bacterium]
MPRHDAWVDDANVALLVDLYELTMAQAYWRQGMDDDAVFSLYFRELPATRNYILACGLADALRYLERLHFAGEHLAYLDSLGHFSAEFLDWLADLRFTGDVWAAPEGTPLFPEEPFLEVEGPIAAAQIAETFVMNQVCFQSVLASKAARVVTAADGRAVVDFGLRRMHGTDAGMKAARAFHVAGVAATSNVLAGEVYGVPVTGTMAHSYVQSHDDELEAFRAFVTLYPDTVLLVDTYDTLAGVEKVVALARELGGELRLRAIRLDSGDLGALARRSRSILDRAGLEQVEIFASGGLDEERIAGLLAAGAPIDGFGVGTEMGVSRDAPSLDMAYKLTAYAGLGRLKTSPGKQILPGRKQVFRREEGGEATGDVIARADEELPGRPLLEPVMRRGEVTSAEVGDLEAARARARREIALLPPRIRALPPADPPYPVAVSEALVGHQNRVRERVEGG